VKYEELKSIQEKIDKGTHILVYKIPNLTNWDLIDNIKKKMQDTITYKAIHKKDDNILIKYLEDKRTVIMYKNKTFPKWYPYPDFIEMYDEENEYILRNDIEPSAEDILENMLRDDSNNRKKLFNFLNEISFNLKELSKLDIEQRKNIFEMCSRDITRRAKDEILICNTNKNETQRNIQTFFFNAVKSRIKILRKEILK